MKTLILLEVTHAAPINHLEDLIAGRAWTISGVSNVRAVPDTAETLRQAGFSEAEIALGNADPVRT